jgi:hypothetical protein
MVNRVAHEGTDQRFEMFTATVNRPVTGSPMRFKVNGTAQISISICHFSNYWLRLEVGGLRGRNASQTHDVCGGPKHAFGRSHDGFAAFANYLVIGLEGRGTGSRNYEGQRASEFVVDHGYWVRHCRIHVCSTCQ